MASQRILKGATKRVKFATKRNTKDIVYHQATEHNALIEPASYELDLSIE